MYHHPSRAAKTGRVVARDVSVYKKRQLLLDTQVVFASLALPNPWFVCTGCELWLALQLAGASDPSNREADFETGTLFFNYRSCSLAFKIIDRFIHLLCFCECQWYRLYCM